MENDTYDFGYMETHSAGQHDFVVHNKGTAPLKLAKGETTCKCTVAKLTAAGIPPGGQAVVTIEWSAKSFDGSFRHSATVTTNDPDRPEVTFAIKGWVTAAARSSPSEIVFSRVSTVETATAAVRLFGYGSEQELEAKGFRLDDDANARYFDVALRRLSADQIKDEPGAKSGWEVLVTLKPGLPVGPFGQKISVPTNLKKAPLIEIPIRGEVVSDISIAGAEYDQESGVMTLGTIKGSEGAERTVRILVRGPYCKDVKFEATDVFPSLLRVKIGKTTEMSNGSVTITPLTVEIPKGSPSANHLGVARRASERGRYGRIMLKTHHPQSPELRIYVRFAVEG